MNEINDDTAPLTLAPSRRSALLRSALVIYAVTFTAFALASHETPLSESPTMILLSAILGGLIAVYLGFLLSAVEADTKTMLLLIGGGVAVDVAFNFLGAWQMASGMAGQMLGAALKGVANLGVLTAATGAGLLVAKGLREPHYLIMAAVVGAITDIFSVYAGPTKHLVTTKAFPYVSYQWGLIGNGGVVPCIGLGDFIFLVLFMAGVRKFGLNQHKTLFAMAAAIVVGFLSTLLSPRGIPALPFMSVGLLVVNLRALQQMQSQTDTTVSGA